MSSTDDDIRADFLAEAGELVERLGEQLIDLERRPDDSDLLNAVFRAFHTVKGGAGFLAIHPLVEVCHAAEDLLNVLRSRRREVDADVMDALLQALDGVQRMMQEVRGGEAPQPVAVELIERLHALLEAPDAASKAAAPVVAAPAATPASSGSSATISDDEFEALLDKLHGAPAAPAAPPPSRAADSSNTISDDEFEALLDDLHGKKAAAPTAAPTPAAPAPKPRAAVLPPRKLAAVPAAAAPSRADIETVRVETPKLDRLMNLVGELVLVRNRLKSLRGNLDEATSRAVGELDFITRSLQTAVTQVRMQPIKKVFSRFPKLARDIARGLGKEVEVVLVGEDTDLDKNLVDALADPLVHMVRNSVDHGIETPDIRLAGGKPAAGTLTLAAIQEGDGIRIEIRDDGAGIDPERVRAKAVEKGVIDASTAAQLSVDDCLQLIFLPGFSTKEQVSDLSGRGVGMDVVMSSIKQLHGSVELHSKLGQGTTFRIRVPLTLAVLPALIVRAHGRRFALPLAPIADIFELDPNKLQKLDRWDAVLVRGTVLRLVDLEPWINAGSSPAGAPRHVVVANVGDERYGFVVSDVVGREEIVIKPLGASLRGLAGISGATVMPDGRVALILDFAGLIAAARGGTRAVAGHG